jgi:ADP-ribose pyrophosphatase YjhB (NUDIX family)
MERFKLVPAVHLFLFREDKILLIRRANSGFFDGYYSVPAGHLDGNETAAQAMVREAMEEICITINPKDLKAIHVMHRKSEEERIDFFFTTKKWLAEPRIGEPDKCDDLGWFPFDNLPKNIVPYVRFAINRHHYGVFYSEFGWPE